MKSTANFWVDDPAVQYQFGGYALSGDKKTLTVTVNKLTSVVLGVLQQSSAANGVSVQMSVRGR